MNKIDFVLLFDVTDANPNGDPDAGNMPRIDPENYHGLITDVCLKRKVRNFVTLRQEGATGYSIYVKEKAVLTKVRKDVYEALGLNKNKDKDKAIELDKKSTEARDWMCKNFFDIRTFGAVMSLSEANCGQVRGPVQLSFARSIDPISVQEFSLTRCAVETEKESNQQKGGNRTMGRKFTVPYALYMCKGTINPYLADQTGFGEKDLELLLESFHQLFEFDASAARPAGALCMRKIVLFKHDSKLGNAPAHKLYESLIINKKDGVEYPRSISDYEIKLDKTAFSSSIIVEEI